MTQKFIKYGVFGSNIMEIDKTDQKIITLLQENSKLSSRKIAKKTLIPITTVYNRIKKLEQEGIIKKYSIVLDEEKMGKILTAYVLMHYDISVWGKESTKKELKKQLLSLPSVEEVKYIVGRYDILLKARLSNMGELNHIILEKTRRIPGIGQTETFFVLEDLK